MTNIKPDKLKFLLKAIFQSNSYRIKMHVRLHFVRIQGGGMGANAMTLALTDHSHDHKTTDKETDRKHYHINLKGYTGQRKKQVIEGLEISAHK